MTETNGEFRHLEFIKRRGRRAPSECLNTPPKALSTSKYDIINGEKVDRAYSDKFNGFDPNRPLNLFEKAQEIPRRLTKTLSEPKFSIRSSRPKIPDVLSKPKVPEELINTRSYDHDFWSTTSSVAGDTESVYTIEDDFDGKCNVSQSYEMPRFEEKKYHPGNERHNTQSYVASQQSQRGFSPPRYEAPSSSPPRNDQYRSVPTRNEQPRQSPPRQSPPRFEQPKQNTRTYILPQSNGQRHTFQDHRYEQRRNEGYRNHVPKYDAERYDIQTYEKASSSVSQQAFYRRV